ncbi:MAG: uroporphyrinogen decarboxylase [Ferroplasma sp.]
MNDFQLAIRHEGHDKIPVWFMRQAGRYMALYQEIKKDHSIREICMDAGLTEKITYEPVKILNVDAAIIFADIILPLEAMGFKIDFLESGPSISNGYINNPDMHGISQFTESGLKYKTIESIKLFRRLHPGTPLIGFSGGIITILSYLLTGTSDNNLAFTKKIMLNDKKFNDYRKLVKDMVIKYLKIQINAGVDAVQIFDSWAGALSPYYFERYLKDDIIEIVNEIRGTVPLIYFATGNSGMIEEFNDIKPDYLSVDWRIKLSHARKVLDSSIGLQGNLDPYTVQYSGAQSLREADYILGEDFDKNEYIFNLGHGVLPKTDASTLKNLAEHVHNFEKNK